MSNIQIDKSNNSAFVRKSQNNILELAGLKGFAAFAVVCSHFAYTFYPAMQTAEYELAHHRIIEMVVHRSPLYLFINGEFMVKIFWCISGFLMSFLWQKNHSVALVRKQIINRYLKLVVPISVSLLLTWLFVILNVMKTAEAASCTNSLWLAGFYQMDPRFLDVLKEGFIDVFFYGKSEYNPILWTMKGELFGGFFAGVLLVFCSGSKYKWVYYICSAIFSAIFFIPLLCFIIGIIIGELYSDGLKIDIKSGLCILSLAILISSFLPIWRFIPQFVNIIGITLDIGGLVYGFAAGGAILVITCSSKVGSFFTMKPFQLLGRYSMETFLLHWPLICSVACNIFLLVNNRLNYDLAVIISFVIFMLSLAVLVVIFQKLIVNPWKMITIKIWNR